MMSYATSAEALTMESWNVSGLGRMGGSTVLGLLSVRLKAAGTGMEGAAPP